MASGLDHRPGPPPQRFKDGPFRAALARGPQNPSLAPVVGDPAAEPLGAQAPRPSAAEVAATCASPLRPHGIPTTP